MMENEERVSVGRSIAILLVVFGSIMVMGATAISLIVYVFN
jgi:hypothetical protein